MEPRHPEDMERSLRESERRYRDLLDSLTDPVFLLDEEWRCVLVNEAGARLVHGVRDALIGRPFLEVLPGAEETVFYAAYTRVMEGRQAEQVQGEFTFPDGHTAFFEVRVFPVAEGILCVARDISERHKVQQAQKLETLGVLAGGIAHDFNNLLMGILGAADLALRRGDPGALTRGYLEQILESARHAAELTEQILAYSGKGSFDVAPLDLNEQIEEMRSLLERSCSRRAILEFRLAEGLPAIEGNAAQIDQILLNLVTNASEALAGQSGCIVVTTRRAERRLGAAGREALCLSVSDTGSGMDEGKRVRIFDPYFTTKPGGRGLGLAAVDGIVRAHGGEIEAESAPGAGTTLRVFLPASARRPRRKPPTTRRHRRPLSGTALLVDDEETVRWVSRELLEELGFAVLVAADGAEAVTLFRDHASEVTCILLDLNMPRMGGRETLAALRRIREDVPVLLSSGYDEEMASRQWAGERIAGFIQKPYELEGLEAALDKALSRRC